jgi:hypothetical protein
LGGFTGRWVEGDILVFGRLGLNEPIVFFSFPIFFELSKNLTPLNSTHFEVFFKKILSFSIFLNSNLGGWAGYVSLSKKQISLYLTNEVELQQDIL